MGLDICKSKLEKQIEFLPQSMVLYLKREDVSEKKD